MKHAIVITEPAGTAVVSHSLDAITALDHYNHWLFGCIRPHISGRVLEVGSGTGNMTRCIARFANEVIGVEPVADFVNRFRQRFSGCPNVRAFHGLLHHLPLPEDESSAFDCVVSSNVLEHIEDDVQVLSQMREQLRPGGKVVAFVPAGRWAYGALDVALGHHRRYTLGSLRQAMEQAGLVWDSGAYFNRVGYFGWMFNSVILKKRQVPAAQAGVFNQLVPVLQRLERLLPLPFGQSVWGVARKPLAEQITKHAVVHENAVAAA